MKIIKGDLLCILVVFLFTFIFLASGCVDSCHPAKRIIPNQTGCLDVEGVSPIVIIPNENNTICENGTCSLKWESCKYEIYCK